MKTSAGLVVYRKRGGKIEVLLGHIGGPWLAKKDKGAWSIPKGEYTDGNPKSTAKREFNEETGFTVPAAKWAELGEIKQKSGKVVTAWAVEGDFDAARARSNTAKVEWPPRSGQIQEYPEVDRMEWFDISQVEPKLVSGQFELMQRLAENLNYKIDDQPAPELNQQTLL